MEQKSRTFLGGIVLAMAAVVLTVTLAAPPNAEGDSAAPIPPRATIYRP
jgi:hypothetical protein